MKSLAQCAIDVSCLTVKMFGYLPVRRYHGWGKTMPYCTVEALAIWWERNTIFP